MQSDRVSHPFKGGSPGCSAGYFLKVVSLHSGVTHRYSSFEEGQLLL